VHARATPCSTRAVSVQHGLSLTSFPQLQMPAGAIDGKVSVTTRLNQADQPADLYRQQKLSTIPLTEPKRFHFGTNSGHRLNGCCC
jgi:hypothetical protein